MGAPVLPSTSSQAYAAELLRRLLAVDYWALAEGGGAGQLPQPRQVPHTFASTQEYLDVFEPLLLEECAAQLLRGNEDGQLLHPQPAVSTGATSRDEFLVADLVLRAGAPAAFAAGDMVLLSRDDPREEAADRQHHALAAVEAHQGDTGLQLRFYLAEAAQVSEAGRQRCRLVRQGLAAAGSSCWWLLKLASMATISREWVALHSLAAVPFAPLLLSARSTAAAQQAKQRLVPQGMREAMEREYNESQMRAVTAGLGGSPVVLIQGPPGTGKTKTILGLLAILMHSAPQLRGEGGAGEAGSALTPVQRHSAWLAACPWLMGTSPRDAVQPWDERGDSGSAFGLLARDAPTRISNAAAPRARVLVCAPSNSALDEIVGRLLAVGLVDSHGQPFTPRIVRVGVSVHHSVAAAALDTLADQRLASAKDTKGGAGASGAGRAERERARQAVLEEADIVCSTLAFSGSGIFARLARRFDCVVVDEAAQAVEPSTLVPLTLGARQVYLVGDPIQLPATVISSRAVTFGYDVSLFKRLQEAGYPVNVLDTQYRMHPIIAEFPSQQFYGGKLRSAPAMADAAARPWHAHAAFGPLAMFDVAGRESVPEDSMSIINRVEVEMVLCLYRELVHRWPDLRTSGRCAVISPYKAQVSLLRAKFAEALGEAGARAVDINTIDGFQGREKDVTIFSTVRSAVGRSIGFVSDERRINVGLTRARSSLLVIGNARALARDPRWSALVAYAAKHKALFRPVKPFPEYLERVVKGEVGPVPESEVPPPRPAPAPAAAQLPAEVPAEEWQPQAEPGVYEDEDAYSDYEDMPAAPAGGGAGRVHAHASAQPAPKTVEALPAKKRGAAAAPAVSQPAGKRSRKGKA